MGQQFVLMAAGSSQCDQNSFIPCTPSTTRKEPQTQQHKAHHHSHAVSGPCGSLRMHAAEQGQQKRHRTPEQGGGGTGTARVMSQQKCNVALEHAAFAPFVMFALFLHVHTHVSSWSSSRMLMGQNGCRVMLFAFNCSCIVPSQLALRAAAPGAALACSWGRPLCLHAR